MQRILALRWTPADPGGAAVAARLAERARAERPWTQLTDRRGVLLLWSACPIDRVVVILPGESGVIIGHTFRRDGGASRRLAAAELSPELIESWRVTGGDAFLNQHWGAYLAILHDRQRDELHVIRDPMGARACFMSEVEGVHAIFTHAADLRAIAPDLAIDEDYLAAFIAQPRLVARRSAIKGVSEILPGEHISFGRTGMRSGMGWRPLVQGCRTGLDFPGAAARLRATGLECAGAWAQGAGRILHQLSGGLDSSVALACLAEASKTAEIVCVNQRPSNTPEGDERIPARASAERANVRLVEQKLDPGHVDYATLRTPELTAKPSLSHFSFARRPLGDLGEENWDLLTSGKGGDQIFQRSVPALIAADAVGDRLSVSDCLGAALDVARRGRRSVWETLAAQVWHGVCRRPIDDVLATAAGPLATEKGTCLARQETLCHPWLSEPRRTTPGRAFRVRRLMDLQYYHNTSSHEERFVCANVLASQPIVEICLGVPPYVMIAGGKDRALERAAFAPMLAPEVAERTSKGETTRYFTAILERNMPFIREILIDGELERRGLIDGPGMRAALSSDILPVQAVKAGLTAALIAELWIRRFEEERRSRTYARQSLNRSERMGAQRRPAFHASVRSFQDHPRGRHRRREARSRSRRPHAAAR